MKSVRYSLIYKFFSAHIEFGYYKTGGELPSIDELTKVYHASSRTVRNAYAQLQQDGYIALSSGRKTTVVYQATEEECVRNCRTYYLARSDAILALNGALNCLLPPLMKEGCRCMGAEEMEQVEEIAMRLGDGDFYISFFCGHAMLAALNNSLALYLFNDVVSFYQFPHTLLRRWGNTLDQQRLHALSQKVVSACERRDWEALLCAYWEIQDFMDQVLYFYMVHAQVGFPIPEQIPFEWEFYREYPQRCYSTAAQIIEQIFVRYEYAPGDALPSYGEMTKMYSASFSTVRRAIDMLEKLGVASPSQGAKTKVTMPECDTARLRHAVVRRVLTSFREVMQILNICFDSIVGQVTPLTSEKNHACIAQIQGMVDDDGTAAFIACIDYLFQGQAGFRGIWDRFYEALLLGLPLLKAGCGGQTAAASIKTLVCSLKADDMPAFLAALKKLMLRISRTADRIADASIASGCNG